MPGANEPLTKDIVQDHWKRSHCEDNQDRTTDLVFLSVCLHERSCQQDHDDRWHKSDAQIHRKTEPEQSAKLVLIPRAMAIRQHREHDTGDGGWEKED